MLGQLCLHLVCTRPDFSAKIPFNGIHPIVISALALLQAFSQSIYIQANYEMKSP